MPGDKNPELTSNRQFFLTRKLFERHIIQELRLSARTNVVLITWLHIVEVIVDIISEQRFITHLKDMYRVSML